jgi:hypothetical protein
MACIAAALFAALGAAPSARASPLLFPDGDPAHATAAEVTTATSRPTRALYDLDAASSVAGPYVAWRTARDLADDSRGYVIDATPVAAPEPGPFVVLLAGLLGLAWARRRRRR